MASSEWLDDDPADAGEDSEEGDEKGFAGESGAGRCPWCGVTPVYAEGAGGGLCAHYLGLYDCWTEQMDAPHLPVLPRLGDRWCAVCANLFPIAEDQRGENVFSPSALLAESFAPNDLAMLNAWATEGLCAVPTWDEVARDLILTQANGVRAIGYATGTVYYAADLGNTLDATVRRLAAGFDRLEALLEARHGSDAGRRTDDAA